MIDKKEELLINDILSRATQYKAPKNISVRAFQAWKEQEDSRLVDSPIVPTWAWVGLLLFYVGVFVWGYDRLSTTGGESLFSRLTSQAVERLGDAFIGLELVTLSVVLVLAGLILVNGYLVKARFRGVGAG